MIYCRFSLVSFMRIRFTIMWSHPCFYDIIYSRFSLVSSVRTGFSVIWSRPCFTIWYIPCFSLVSLVRTGFTDIWRQLCLYDKTLILFFLCLISLARTGFTDILSRPWPSSWRLTDWGTLIWRPYRPTTTRCTSTLEKPRCVICSKI